MSAEEVAQRTLEALAKGQSIVVTGWLNRCIAWVGQHAPKVWGARIGAALLRRMRFKPHAAVKLKEAKHG
jgi:short-subunit dehydrogenase